jgi:hypothetical protein
MSLKINRDFCDALAKYGFVLVVDRFLSWVIYR